MEKKGTYIFLLIFSLVFVVQGIMNTLDKLYIGPIGLAFALIFAVSTIFKIKKYYNRQFYTAIIVIILALMLILEYSLIPMQIILYLLLSIVAIGLFIIAYTLLIPENWKNRREKILTVTGLILWLMPSFILGGLINNKLTDTLIIGTLFTIIIIIFMLIDLKKHKNNALEN
ncbi:hypothetical protein [Methanobacterium oryzae]|uniref:hypothetical protein n=1 Tax=Methanobacterium oryzae TaxID=69540 RepID=UPI003D2623DB